MRLRGSVTPQTTDACSKPHTRCVLCPADSLTKQDPLAFSLRAEAQTPKTVPATPQTWFLREGAFLFKILVLLLKRERNGLVSFSQNRGRGQGRRREVCCGGPRPAPSLSPKERHFSSASLPTPQHTPENDRQEEQLQRAS